MVVEHDTRRAVRGPDRLVGQVRAAYVPLVDEVGPPRPIDGQVDARRDRVAHDRPLHAAGVADEQRSRACRRLGELGMESARVRGLQQRLDGYAGPIRHRRRPGQARGEGEVVGPHLLRSHLVGVADHPEQVHLLGPQGRSREPAEVEHDVVEARGGPVVRGTAVDGDVLAEAAQRSGEVRGEVHVPPLVALVAAGRRDLDRPSQRRPTGRRPCPDRCRRAHDRLGWHWWPWDTAIATRE